MQHFFGMCEVSTLSSAGGTKDQRTELWKYYGVLVMHYLAQLEQNKSLYWSCGYKEEPGLWGAQSGRTILL